MKKSIVFAAVAVTAALALTGCKTTLETATAQQQQQPQAAPQIITVPQEVEKEKPTLSVNGTGEYSVKPDMATISFGVFAEDKDAEKAQQKSSEVLAKALESIKAAGVKDEDIQTTGFDLSAIYDYDVSPAKMTGYRSYQSASMKIYDIDTIGAVLDAAVNAGINDMDSIQFGLRDENAAYRKALEAAVQDAAGKADVMAAAAGIKLAGIATMAESGSGAAYTVENDRSYEMPEAAAADSKAAVSVGMMKVTANVTLNYTIATSDETENK